MIHHLVTIVVQSSKRPIKFDGGYGKFSVDSMYSVLIKLEELVDKNNIFRKTKIPWQSAIRDFFFSIVL
jgi:hypothetical protein